MVLRAHRVSHLRELHVDPALLALRFSSRCATSRCDARCCRDGVWLDLGERDRILAHTDTIRNVMDTGQERDPARWFDGDERADSDFPSGRAVGTAVRDTRCVFLDGRNRCVLQVAGPGLKPFFCTAFPVTLEYGTLTFDTPAIGPRVDCCTPTATGSRTIFEAWPAELEHVLGPEGVSELRRYAERDRG